jgi:hypothetical protein
MIVVVDDTNNPVSNLATVNNIVVAMDNVKEKLVERISDRAIQLDVDCRREAWELSNVGDTELRHFDAANTSDINCSEKTVNCNLIAKPSIVATHLISHESVVVSLDRKQCNSVCVVHECILCRSGVLYLVARLLCQSSELRDDVADLDVARDEANIQDETRLVVTVTIRPDAIVLDGDVHQRIAVKEVKDDVVEDVNRK